MSDSKIKPMETVKIVDPDKKNDFLIINASDFNSKKHILWENRAKRRSYRSRTPEIEKVADNKKDTNDKK